MGLIVKSNIKKAVKELQMAKEVQSLSGREKDNSITSVAEEVETALEKKVENLIIEGIKRAKANQRRTLQARDL